MRITVGLAQIYPKLGDLEHNLTLHLDYLRQARDQNVDLLVFPELSMTGYQVQDLVPEVALRADADDQIFAELLEASRDIDIVLSASCMRTSATAFTSPTPIYPAASYCKSTTSSICRPTPCSTNRAISRKATAYAPSIPASVAWAC